MEDPSRLYRLETDVDVTESSARTLVVALSGFMDAGHVQKLIVEHLLESLEHRVVATFDLDQLLDYRGRRPLMTYDRDRWSDYADPTLALYRLVDDEGTPFLLLAGPEPDYQWERVVEAIRGLSEGLGVTMTAGVHGAPMGVPHTRPIGASFHGTDAARRREHSPVFGEMKIPGSLGGLLELRLGESGHDAFGFAVHVPHYLAQSDFAPGALAGLEALADTSGLRLPDTKLRLASAETMRAVESELEAAPDAREVVHALERQYDDFTRRPNLLEVQGGELPTADELGEEFEAFLREQDPGDADVSDGRE